MAASTTHCGGVRAAGLSMAGEGIYSLVVALALPRGRNQAATALAAALGCGSLALLVRDAELGGMLLPAPGMPKTLPGGPQ